MLVTLALATATLSGAEQQPLAQVRCPVHCSVVRGDGTNKASFNKMECCECEEKVRERDIAQYI